MDSPHHRAKRGVGRMETGIRASNTYGYSLSKRANRAFGDYPPPQTLSHGTPSPSPSRREHPH
jgi:hypothetical protein